MLRYSGPVELTVPHPGEEGIPFLRCEGQDGPVRVVGDTAFFERIVEEAGMPPDGILYVGDRLDNDVAPAKAVGMWSAFIQQDPWGWIQRDLPLVDELTDFRIDL